MSNLTAKFVRSNTPDLSGNEDKVTHCTHTVYELSETVGQDGFMFNQFVIWSTEHIPWAQFPNGFNETIVFGLLPCGTKPKYSQPLATFHPRVSDDKAIEHILNTLG